VPLAKPSDATPYLPSDSARMFLFSADSTRITDLGQPSGSASQSQVSVRGAHKDDRLCVFDQAAASLGCAGLTANIQSLTIAPRPDWQPDVIVTKDVAIYHYGKDAQGELVWQRLPAPLGNAQNEVTAQLKGAGLYVLMARPWKSRLGLVVR
jgi:hypothetical protein